MNKLVTALMLAGLLGLSGCQSNEPKNGTTINRIRDTLEEGQADARTRPAQTPPPAVSAALLPPINLNLPAVEGSDEARFDVNVANAPAREFLMGLVEGTPYNMVVHPEVQGQLSLSLKNVTIPEVMRVLRDVYGYEYERTSGGYHVLPVRLQSRIFQVNYLNVKRAGTSEMNVSSGQVSSASSDDDSGDSSSSADTVSSSQITTLSESDFWSELRVALQAIVGDAPGRTVVVSPQSGIVVVRAMPAELREVESFLNTTQHSLLRQVILEAKIVEVELNDGYQAGINWSKLVTDNGRTLTLGQTGGGTALGDSGVSGISGNTGNLNPSAFSALDATAVTAFGGVFTAALKAGSFAAFLELLESQGNVQVLSSPRVSTVNNQKAVIKVGKDEFFVTDISTTTVTGNTTTSTPEVTLTPFFSGIALDVTPQIDPHGAVTLHIHPSVTEVTDQTKTFQIDDKTQTLPLALSTVRESDSIVHARSGQVVVIGGLMQDTTSESTASTPVLGDLPFIGAAFRHTKQAAKKSELVILLRPMVVDSPSVWGEEMSRSARRMDDLDRGFHVGGHPEVFGTRGETE